MVILFLNKRIHNWDKVNIFQVKSLLSGFLPTFFQLTELQVAPRKLETAGFKRPFFSAPGGHSEMPAAGHHCSYLTPGHCLVAPHARHQAFTSIFSVPYNPPNIHTEKKFVFSLLTYRTYFICRIFRKMSFKL